MRARLGWGTGRTTAAVAAACMLVASCSGGGSSSDGSTTTEDPPASSTTATSTSEAGSTSTSEGTSDTTTTSAPGIPGATDGPHSGPADGTGTALLRAVRIGSHDGYDRIVFEFEGTSTPGYQIQWVEPPILSDGAGETVEVAGEAFLEAVIQPASGVDLSAPELVIVYEGPDRLAASSEFEVIDELVRTGDFEAVLTWVAGATERVPFRVQTLTSPTRLVIDLEHP